MYHEQWNCDNIRRNKAKAAILSMQSEKYYFSKQGGDMQIIEHILGSDKTIQKTKAVTERSGFYCILIERDDYFILVYY